MLTDSFLGSCLRGGALAFAFSIAASPGVAPGPGGLNGSLFSDGFESGTARLWSEVVQ